MSHLSSPEPMGTPSSPTPAQQAALDLLRDSRRVLLTGHERPDGDCLGSQVALARVLAAGGREVLILEPDPPEPRHAFVVEGVDLRVWEGGALPPHDVSVLLDASELERTGRLAPILAASPVPTIVVDHHPHVGDAWWDEAYRDPAAAATGILVRRIARALDAPLDPISARALFVALVTDTGWFRFGNSDGEALGLATELVELGVQPDVMYRRLHQVCDLAHPTRVGKVLEKLEYHLDGRLGVILVPGPAGLEVDPPAAEDVLDLVRSVRDVEVVLLAREVRPGVWKLSARSKTCYDVSALARRFGGGGHVRAAGATLNGAAQEVRARLVAAADAGFEREVRA